MTEDLSIVPNGMNAMPSFVIIGYVILRNMKYLVGTQNVNSIEWRPMETGFKIDYVKKKLYQYKKSAEEAVEQLKKYNPNDDYEVHPVYWIGR